MEWLDNMFAAGVDTDGSGTLSDRAAGAISDAGGAIIAGASQAVTSSVPSFFDNLFGRGRTTDGPTSVAESQRTVMLRGLLGNPVAWVILGVALLGIIHLLRMKR